VPASVSRALAVGVVALGLVLGAASAATASPRAPAARVAGPVVLLGTGGLRWDDVGADTPALSSLLDQDAVGALAARSVRDSTCPVDGWLAVSAGRRAADVASPPGAVGGCRVPQPAGPTAGAAVQSPDWPAYRGQAGRDRFDADPGLLADTLARAGRRIAAVGPGAAIAAADRQGRVAASWPGVPAGAQGTLDPGGDALGLSRQVTAALATGADLVIVDLGAVRDVPERPTPAADQSADQQPTGPPTRAEQVAGLDARLGLILDTLPATATVITASLADSGPGAHLQLVAAHGPAAAPSARYDGGYLRSSSTRQDGLVQTTDLLPSLTALLGVAAPTGARGAVGAPVTRSGDGGSVDRLRRLLDLDAAALAVQDAVTPFFVVLGVTELAVLAGLALPARRARRRPVLRRRLLVALRAAAVTASLVPVATFAANLLPWWRSPLPGQTLGLLVAAATVPLAVLALVGPWRRPLLGPAGVAGALIVLALTADLATGSGLQLAALIGGEPILAGRFYGLSNPTFALFATGGLFAALAVAERLRRHGRPGRDAALAVAAIGAVLTVIDVLPALGSDFGGPPALVPAFALLALRVAGVRLTWRRAGLVALATVGVLVAASALDWLRPADRRSHLGRFAQTVLDGGAWSVVGRKLQQNLELLTFSPLTLSVPVAAVVIVLLLRRPGRWYAPALESAYRRQPLLRSGLAALGVLLLLGFAANDSGTSIPPAALLVFGPFLIGIAARAVELDDADREAAALAAAARPIRPSKKARRR
jgi:hypothetical protein